MTEETSAQLPQYFFLVNPNAGHGRALPVVEHARRRLEAAGATHQFAYTAQPGHARVLVREAIAQGHRRFVVVGGDGTLNEAVNGIFSQTEVPGSDISLGLVPAGTGNDWQRYYGFDSSADAAMDRVLAGRTRPQDIGQVVYSDADGGRHAAYFINIAGLCFDAEVVRATNAMKENGRRTRLSYLWCLVRSLLVYRPWTLAVDIEGERLEGKFLSMSVGNGRYSGGGMVQTPGAVIDDGLLDVTLYGDMSKLSMALGVPKLYNDKILTLKGVRSFKTRAFRVEAAQPVFAEIDGELIGDGPYEISVKERAINVFV